MSQITNILKIAATEIGYNPVKPDYNKYCTWYYGRQYNTAYCGIFLAWCAHQAGIPDSIIPQKNINAAWVPSVLDWFQKQGRYKKASGYAPKPGDFIFFDFNRNGTPDHIGIVERYANGTVTTIEGNTSTSSATSSNGGYVARKKRALPWNMVLGFAAPNYEEVYDVENKTFLINGKEESIPTVFVDNKNYPELRTIAELLGYEVDYDAAKKLPVLIPKEGTEKNHFPITLDLVGDSIVIK